MAWHCAHIYTYLRAILTFAVYLPLFFRKANTDAENTSNWYL